MNTGTKDGYVVIEKISGRIATLMIGESERILLVDIGILPAGSEKGDWLKIDEEGRLLDINEQQVATA